MRTIRLFMWLVVWSGCTWGVGAGGCGGDIGIEKPVCMPTTTCEAQGATCGSIDDGCGLRLRCGTCPSSELCGAQQANTCGRVCAKDGWCWEHPLPHGFSFQGVFPAAADDVWAVGQDGFAIRFDGQTWSKVDIGASRTVRSISGSAPDDVWAAAGALYHFDGRTWRATTPQSAGFELVEASKPDAVYALGTTLSRWDGTAWQALTGSPPTYPTSLVVFGPGEVWATGYRGTPHVFRHDGSDWVEVGALPATVWIAAIAGTAVNDVWAVGYDRDPPGGDEVTAVAWHWDGGRWSARHEGIEAYRGASSVAITASGEVWTALKDVPQVGRWNGRRWELAPAPVAGGARRLVPRAGGELWLFGDNGLLARRFADRWEAFGEPRGATAFTELWASGRDDVWWAASNTDLLRWDGVRLASAGKGAWAVGGSSPTDVWAISGSNRHLLEHYDGSQWTSVATGVPAALASLWVESPTHAWAVGVTASGPTAIEWDGVAWAQRALPAQLGPIHGSHGKNLWGLEARQEGLQTQQRVYRYDGVSWVERPGATGTLYALWAIADDDVWVSASSSATNGSRFWHWTGAGWTPYDPPCAQPGVGNCQQPTSLWARASNDVWAASFQGALFHWDGQAWRSEQAPMDFMHIEALYGAGNELWLAAFRGGLLHKVR